MACDLLNTYVLCDNPSLLEVFDLGRLWDGGVLEAVNGFAKGLELPEKGSPPLLVNVVVVGLAHTHGLRDAAVLFHLNNF